MKTFLILLIITAIFVVRMVYLYRQKKKISSSPTLEIEQLVGEKYIEFLKEARWNENNKVYSNGGEPHAIALLKELIEAGRRKEILIYEHSFPSKLFMSEVVCRALRDALALDTEIKILYNENTEDLITFKEAMKNYVNILYRQTHSLPDGHESATGIQLFGELAYRYEFTEEGHGSYFSFNQPHTVKTWKDRLLKMWNG